MRQVYFDPFGSYMRGAQQGQTSEIALQEAGRQARQQDWGYYNLNPLQLQQQRNATALDTAQLPYSVATLPLAYRGAQLSVYGQEQAAAAPSTYAGDLGPLDQAFFNNYGYHIPENMRQNYKDYAVQPFTQAWYGLQSGRLGAEGMAQYRAGQGALATQEITNMQNGEGRWNTPNNRSFGEPFSQWDSLWHGVGGFPQDNSPPAPYLAPTPAAQPAPAPVNNTQSVPGYPAPTTVAPTPQEPWKMGSNFGVPPHWLPGYRDNSTDVARSGKIMHRPGGPLPQYGLS